ncbi:MAG: hypothetical protein M3Q68_07660 [Actinomycetota bacterium]|nr:hypothetical protein [Actinomycetota bacterium]
MFASSFAPLVAQCTGSAPCELPTGLPWYFGLAVAVIWLGAVTGVLLLGRRFLARKLRRRRRGPSDRLALGEKSAGAELERW